MSNHRADGRAQTRAVPSAATTGTPGGRRKAAKSSPLSGNPLSGLPMVPTITGAVAVTVAAGGTVTAGLGQASAEDVVTTSGHQAHAAAGPSEDTLEGVPSLADRTSGVSRDSDRTAQSDASDAQLQAAVQTQATQRNAALSSLARSAEKQAVVIKKNMWHLPTEGYHLTARFGSAGGLWSNNHTGLDFAAPSGTPIFAVANGVITSTGYDGSYGNKTVETLEDGTEIWYAHQSAFDVQPGEQVTGGETIGQIGSTGNTTGPHVHIEVRPGGGDPVDPFTAMVYHGLHP